MERLSIDSARALGYDVTVYSFEPERLLSECLPCPVRDARDVVDAAILDDFRSVSPSHLTDHFRLEAISQGRGTWIDLDIVFLRRLPDLPYLFGWQSAKTICNAVLRLPADSPLLADYIDLCRQGRKQGIHHLPPWYPWPNRMNRSIKNLLGKRRSTPIYGPRTLTHLVHKHRLAHLAQSCTVFNPIPSDKVLVARMLDHWPEDAITPDTVCVHLWRSLWNLQHRCVEPPWAARILRNLVNRAAVPPGLRRTG
jgi:hypothetical protein